MYEFLARSAPAASDGLLPAPSRRTPPLRIACAQLVAVADTMAEARSAVARPAQGPALQLRTYAEVLPVISLRVILSPQSVKPQAHRPQHAAATRRCKTPTEHSGTSSGPCQMWQPWAGSLANVIGLCTFFSAQTCAFSSTACTNGREVFMGHREP